MREEQTLPEMPEPENEADTDDCTYSCPEGFSREQMEAYGLACFNAGRAEAGKDAAVQYFRVRVRCTPAKGKPIDRVFLVAEPAVGLPCAGDEAMRVAEKFAQGTHPFGTKWLGFEATTAGSTTLPIELPTPPAAMPNKDQK